MDKITEVSVAKNLNDSPLTARNWGKSDVTESESGLDDRLVRQLKVFAQLTDLPIFHSGVFLLL